MLSCCCYYPGGMCASGRPAFSCVPCEGTVERDQVKVVKVTFDPDRQSSYYTDKLLVEYNGQVSAKSVVDYVLYKTSNNKRRKQDYAHLYHNS